MSAGSGPAIPRILHQTWKNDTLPADYAAWSKGLRDLHRGWEHRLWTDAANRALVAERYPWFLDTFDGYRHGIERADAVRYFILQTFGGVYVDLDMEWLKPMDPLVEGGGVRLSQEAGPMIFQRVVSNAFMAAPPGHPFFEHVIAGLERRPERDVTFADVFRNTGPDMLDARLRAYGTTEDVVVVRLTDICPLGVIPQNVGLRSRDLDVIREEALLYAIHHNTESWNVQRPPPAEAPTGYVLFEDHDIPGHDVDYVQYDEPGFERIRAACDANPECVGFNFNGYLKGRGGRLAEARAEGRWFKPGIRPWVCVKRDELGGVAP